MPTHPRKHSDARQITAEILKEAAKPRQAASVRDAFEKKKTPVPVAPEKLGEKKGVKTKPA
jgi:hypothetical protein